MSTAPWTLRPLTVLGSTGSIGENTLDVATQLGIPIYALTAHSKVDLLAQQIATHKPTVAVIADAARHAELVKACGPECSTELLAGTDALNEVARADDCGAVVTAIVGAAGLPATLAAVRAGKRVCIANKEPLVMAGELIMREAQRCSAEILPVDSEHSAIHQCLHGHATEDVTKLVITGSGGPFRTVSDLSQVSREQALKHPTWSMGPKITVDSASLMNKSLEIIEARWLFDIDLDRIEVLIHPQSIVHGMVHYRDGSVMAQLGMPDMRTPILHALTHPDHAAGNMAQPDFAQIGSLTFELPDRQRFPTLDMGYAAARAGGLAPVVMNAANEVAVDQFLAGAIDFIDIFKAIDTALSDLENVSDPDLATIIAADETTRERYGATTT